MERPGQLKLHQTVQWWEARTDCCSWGKSNSFHPILGKKFIAWIKQHILRKQSNITNFLWKDLHFAVGRRHVLPLRQLRCYSTGDESQCFQLLSMCGGWSSSIWTTANAKAVASRRGAVSRPNNIDYDSQPPDNFGLPLKTEFVGQDIDRKRFASK